MTNSSLFAVGQPWPPKELKDRRRLYKFNRLLSRGEFKEAFAEYPEANKQGGSADAVMGNQITDQKLPYETVNWHRTINTIFADLVAGGGIAFESMTENRDSEIACRRLWSGNRGALLFWDGVFTAGRDGCAIIGIRTGKRSSVSKREEVIIERWPPEKFAPEIDDSGNVTAGNLVDVVEVMVPDPEHPSVIKHTKALKVIRHTSERIEYLAFEVKGAGSSFEVVREMEAGKKDSGWSVVWESRTTPFDDTKIGELLFAVVPGEPSPDDWHGNNDFGHGVYNLMYTYCRRLGWIHEVLSKFASPVWKVPVQMVTENKKDGTYEFRVGDVIPLQRGMTADDVGVMSWEPRLEEARLSLETTKGQIFLQTDLCDGIFGLTSSGSAESGRSRKYALMPTLRRSSRKIRHWSEAWADILFRAQMLEVSIGIEIPSKDGAQLPFAVRILKSLSNVWKLLTGQGIGFEKAEYAPERPSVKIRMGLPIDEQLIAEVAAAKFTAGLATHEQAFREANPTMEPGDVRDVVEQIREEQEAKSLRESAPNVATRRRERKQADLDKLRTAEPSAGRVPEERPTATQE